MSRSKTGLMIFAIGVCLMAGCSKQPAANAKSGSVAAAANAGPGVSGNACDRKLLSVSDVDGILHEPVTGTAPLKGDPQTCYFVTSTTESAGGPEIMITLRPGLGSVTLKAWIDGSMGTTGTKIGGVGDDAVWVSELKELDAQKNDLLCVAAIAGSGVIDHYDALQQKLSVLCNKIFGRIAS